MTYTWARDAHLTVTCDAPGCGSTLTLGRRDVASPIADAVRRAGWAIRWPAANVHVCPDHYTSKDAPS